MAIHVPINLASEPFRRDRPMLVALGTVAIVAIAAAGYQVDGHHFESAPRRPTRGAASIGSNAQIARPSAGNRPS